MKIFLRNRAKSNTPKYKCNEMMIMMIDTLTVVIVLSSVIK